MAKPRTDLSTVLHGICKNVYFQPPTGRKLEYPCIVYKVEEMSIRYADDYAYNVHDKYDVKYITRNPDDTTRYEFLRIPYCSSRKMYIADNLYHYPFTVYI